MYHHPHHKSCFGCLVICIVFAICITVFTFSPIIAVIDWQNCVTNKKICKAYLPYFAWEKTEPVYPIIVKDYDTGMPFNKYETSFVRVISFPLYLLAFLFYFCQPYIFVTLIVFGVIISPFIASIGLVILLSTICIVFFLLTFPIWIVVGIFTYYKYRTHRQYVNLDDDDMVYHL